MCHKYYSDCNIFAKIMKKKVRKYCSLLLRKIDLKKIVSSIYSLFPNLKRWPNVNEKSHIAAILFFFSELWLCIISCTLFSQDFALWVNVTKCQTISVSKNAILTNKKMILEFYQDLLNKTSFKWLIF